MKQHISIIGIGKLGLCAALVFEKAGYDVIGVDLSEQYINSLNEKKFKSLEPNVERYLSESESFKATTSINDALNHSDIICIYVATPVPTNGYTYDHSILSQLLSQMNEKRIQNKIISINCTVAPGYITNTGRNLIKDCVNCELVYNPEFIQQSNIIEGLTYPDIILIGTYNQTTGQRIKDIYKNVCKNEPSYYIVDMESATLAKIAINCFITTKIAFANMVCDVAKRTEHAKIGEIIDIIGADSRINGKCMNPGFGYGGPCLPRDNRAFGEYAEKIGVTPFIPSATDKANYEHAKTQVGEIIKTINEIGVNTVMFNNVKYKSDCKIPMIDDSQPLFIAHLLEKQGVNVIIHETKDVIEQVKQRYTNKFIYIMKNNSQKNIYQNVYIIN